MNTHRIDLTSVYVLHTRPFRNTSLIVELFSQIYGRVAVVAHSARGPKSRYQGQLQLFTPILASWFGQHELKTLGNIELKDMPIQLNQNPLFCGFYLNELLIRLLQKEDPHPKIFDCYHDSLSRLEKGDAIPIILRLFEKKLLEDLGYGLPLTREVKTNSLIDENYYYQFVPQYGFLRCHENNHDDKDTFFGADLLAIAAEKFERDSTLNAAKRLMRMALMTILGSNPLNSRLLF